MQISLPAVTYGTVATLVITAILVFLRDVAIVEQAMIPLGMILISLLFTFVAVPTHDAVRKSISYWVSPGKFDPSFRIRMKDVTPEIPTTLLVFLLFAMSFLLGDGVVYGVNFVEPLFLQKIGGTILLLVLLIFLLGFIAGILSQIMIAEAFWDQERKLSILIYLMTVVVVIGFPLLMGQSPTIFYPLFARIGVGYLLLGIPQARFNTLRDFFIPLILVLIPLTAYLSGGRIG